MGQKGFMVLLTISTALLGSSALRTEAQIHSTSQQAASVNPIRKVVTMLQMMEKKVIAEGEKEKELYEKYVCYCKSSGGALSKSIADANTKIPELQSDIEEAEALMKQLKEEVAQHQADRAAAKKAMAEATAIREKEAAAFAKEKAEFDANALALQKAIKALEKGMAGSFLQTGSAAVLRRLVLATTVSLSDADRDVLTSFLSNDEGYAPQSGEIVGILKQMLDTFGKNLAELVAAEEKAKKVYEALMDAQTKIVNESTKAIEEKLARIAQLGVDIVNMKEDLSDTEKALIEDTKFLADLEKNCDAKAKEWEERVKMRAMELAALADTIKLLNDDDALELFKKTLPNASLLQVTERASETARRARELVRGA